MGRMHRLARFAHTLFRGRQLDRDLDDELASYVAEMTDRYVRSGMTPADARRAALREVGGVEPVKERVREARVGWGIDTALRDLRYGVRTLRRSPGFALVVVLTLGIGIGANVTMFSVMRAVIWQPLPYPQPERIVVIEAHMNGVTDIGLAPSELQELRRDSRTLGLAASYQGYVAYLEADGEYERVASMQATDDLLPVLGATPLALGRPLRADEAIVGTTTRSVLISDALWRRRFGSDPNVVGRSIQLDNTDVVVAGVLRPDFHSVLPRTSYVQEGVDVWQPLRIGSGRAFRHSGTVARLAEGTTIEQAQAELNVLAARFVAEHPEVYPEGRLQLLARRLDDVVAAPVRPALLALTTAVAFVLLIGCVNIVNLLFARAGTRARELAIRRALGATRGRIARQMFAEHALLAAGGGVAGWIVALGGVALVEWLRPTHLPRQSDIAIDASSALYAIVLSAVVCVLIGMLPVLRLTRERSNEALRAGRGEVATPGARRLQRGLVVAEVALSIVPLVAGGLMVRTFANMLDAPIGFDPSGLLTARMSISFEMFPDAASRWAVQRDALERVRQIPGVEAASAASPLSFSRAQYTRRVGRADDESSPLVLANQQTIVPGYLALARTRLIEGRDLSDEDNTYERMVTVIDERLASQLWPRGSAIGGRLAVRVGDRINVFEVVGVTDSVRTTSIVDTSVSTMMVPYSYQRDWLTLVIRTTRSVADITPELRRAVEPYTRRSLADIRPMPDLIMTSMAATRFTTLLLAGFAATALLLAAIGLYGTLAYLSAQRHKEFGVRVALGASRADVLRVVLREGVLLTLTGTAIGLCGALALAGTLRSLLYGVAPFDPVTLAGVLAVTGLVAVVAAGRPAWRASRIDPIAALRAD